MSFLSRLCKQKYVAMSKFGKVKMPDRLLTPKQVAQELNVSIWVVYRLVKRGDLVAIKVGRLLRVPESSLEAFIDLNRIIKC